MDNIIILYRLTSHHKKKIGQTEYKPKSIITFQKAFCYTIDIHRSHNRAGDPMHFINMPNIQTVLTQENLKAFLSVLMCGMKSYLAYVYAYCTFCQLFFCDCFC